MAFPIGSKPGRQKCWEKGSLKTLDVTKLQVGKEARGNKFSPLAL